MDRIELLATVPENYIYSRDEQNKSEILQECQNLRVSRKTEMPTDNTGKQDEGYTQ